jgi:two-component system, chemotaxis family, chemotaxis protein CheY
MSQTGAPGPPTTPPARILVVDDDDAFRHGIVRVLTGAGYVVEEATDGKKAIEKYRAEPADVVLTDVYMPGGDGVEAMIRLRSEYPDVRIIAMSGGGHASVDSVFDIAVRLGARGTLEKPVNAKTLLRILTEVLGRAND